MPGRIAGRRCRDVPDLALQLGYGTLVEGQEPELRRLTEEDLVDVDGRDLRLDL